MVGSSSRRRRFGIAGVVLAAGLVGPPAVADPQPVPGRPWTSIVPDPDTYDWSQANRPGYRFRGMEPTQQRFYDYIVAKRQAGTPLSWAERAMIRTLTAARRWPEPPRPNEFWAGYMRYLRDLPTDDLNMAQNLMLTELQQRGLVVLDMPISADQQRTIEYLQRGEFRARTWFERYLTGRVEPWLDYALASHGYPLAAPAPGGNVFPPGGTFNGMQISYNVSGATLGGVEDREGFTTVRQVVGTLQPGTMTVSGTVAVGGYGADLTVTVWGGGEDRKEHKVWIPNPGNGGSGSFSLAVEVPQNADAAGFSIRLDGSYSMGGGHRGLVVSAQLRPTEETMEARRRAADEAWRRHVEETLAALGYENTPEGKALAEMRQALAGGDAAWREYVDRELAALGADTSPQAQDFGRLEQALGDGGPTWDDYVRRHVDDQGGDIDVGVELNGGRLTGVANTFDQPTKVSCKLDFADLPENTTVTAVWTRDGEEVIRSERTCGGSGWVSFSLLGGGAALTPGKYNLTVTAGGRQLGFRNFTVR